MRTDARPDFVCADCGTDVYILPPGSVPDDGLCYECRVIAQALPEDRPALKKAFRKM